MTFHRIGRLDDGTLTYFLHPGERAALASLALQVSELVQQGPSDATRRLFPVTYEGRPDLEEDYRELVGDAPTDDRLAALASVSDVADGPIERDDLLTWIQAANSIYLVVSTILGDRGLALDDDVEPDDPSAGLVAVALLLHFLIGEAVEALSPAPETPLDV